MPAPQQRRVRRRAVSPAASLPRPADASGEEGLAAAAARTAVRRHTAPAREHHVTNDYSHVKRDLWTILALGGGTIAFIVAMSFVVQ